jgi:hypothetical protein
LNNKEILMNRLIIYDSLSGNMFLAFILTQGAALGYVIVPFQGIKTHDYFHYPDPRRREDARGEVWCALHNIAIILPLLSGEGMQGVRSGPGRKTPPTSPPATIPLNLSPACSKIKYKVNKKR